MRISRGVPLLLVAGLLLGCGDDDDAASSATLVAERDESTTMTAESTTTTAGDPDAALKAEIERAYHAQWDAFIEIFADPDPTNPLIDEHFTGEQKEQILDGVSASVAAGTALRRPEDPTRFRSTIRSVTRTGERATVEACVVDGLVEFERASGRVLNDAVVVVDLIVTFESDEGQWRVASVQQTRRDEGSDSCGGQ